MGGSIDEHVWRQSYKMSTSQVTFGANLIKCQLLMSTSTVILARILQSVNFSIYRYILGNTNTVVCSDIGNTNTSIHPVSYCPIWDEAVLIPLCGLSLGYHALSLSDQTLFSLPSAHPLRSFVSDVGFEPAYFYTERHARIIRSDYPYVPFGVKIVQRLCTCSTLSLCII